MEKETVKAADEDPFLIPRPEQEKQSSTVQSDGTVKGTDELKGDANDNETEYISNFKLYSMVAALTCIAFLISMNTSVITTVSVNLFSATRWLYRTTNRYHAYQAIPQITDTFDSIQDIGWYGTSYLLTK